MAGGRASAPAFPPEWEDGELTPGRERDHAWWSDTRLVDVPPTSMEAVWAVSSLGRQCQPARLLSLKRVQCRRLWQEYARYRDEVVGPSSIGGEPNERLLFHGTGSEPAKNVLAHPHGLDPRFASDGGFYGRGVYLAEEPNYPLSGRYAHRVAGHDGRRVELLLVRAALGTPQDLGLRVTADTRAMTMPGVRLEGPPRVLYGCVRAGPHRPNASGPGLPPLDPGTPSTSSVVYVLYEARQMYPAYVAELELPEATEVAMAASLSVPPALAGPPPPLPGGTGGDGSVKVLPRSRTCSKDSRRLMSTSTPLVQRSAPAAGALQATPCTPSPSRPSPRAVAAGPAASPAPSPGSGVVSVAASPVTPATARSGPRRPGLALAPPPPHTPDPAQRGVSYPLLAALASKSPAGRARAAAALQGLAADPGKAGVIAASGALPQLVHLLQDSAGGQRGRDSAAGTLRHLCQAGNADVRLAVAAAGGIPALTALLRPPPGGGSPPRARLDAAWALAGLAASKDLCPAVAAAGALVELVLLLREGTVGGRDAAVQAISALSACPELHEQLAASGVVEDLLVLLAAEGCGDGEEVGVQMLTVLRHISSTLDMRPGLLEAGALPVLASALRGRAGGVRAAAAAVVYTLADSELLGLHVAIWEAGVVPPLLELLQGSFQPAREAAAAALDRLASFQGGAASEAEIARVLVALLHHGGADIKLKAASEMRRCLTVEGGGLASEAVSGLIGLLQEAEPEARAAAAFALGDLVAEDGPRVALLRAGAVQGLVGVLRGCEPNARIAVAGLLAALATCDDVRSASASAGALRALVPLLQDGGARVAAAAASALECLIAFSDPSVAVEAPGLAEAAVALLCDGNNRECLRAARLLEAVAPRSEAFCLELIAAGAVWPLAALLGSPSEEEDGEGARAAAAAVLISLAGSHAARTAAADAGLVPALVEVLEDGDVQDRDLTLHVLTRLAAAPDLGSALQEAAAQAPALASLLGIGSCAGGGEESRSASLSPECEQEEEERGARPTVTAGPQAASGGGNGPEEELEWLEQIDAIVANGGQVVGAAPVARITVKIDAEEEAELPASWGARDLPAGTPGP